MNADLLVQSEFIRAVDLVAAGPVTVKISGAELEKLESMDPKKKAKNKGIISFVGRDKRWVINATNKEILKQLFGGGRCGKCPPESPLCKETEHWNGHAITLHAAKVQLGREMTDGIEVKGSPELQAPLTVVVKLPKKREREIILQPTPNRAAS